MRCVGMRLGYMELEALVCALLACVWAWAGAPLVLEAASCTGRRG